MENLILVQGELIGVDIYTLTHLFNKERDKLSRFQVVTKAGERFLPCLYVGATKRGKHKLIVAIAGGDGSFTPTDDMLVVSSNEMESIISRYMGIIHGTIDSLPPVISIPGFENVGIKIHTSAEHQFKFTANIEKNIVAVAKHAKRVPGSRTLIYGPPSSGKTSLAERLADETGIPWMVVSPKWLTIGGPGTMSTLAYVVALASQRKVALLFDDVDELLGLLAGSG